MDSTRTPSVTIGDDYIGVQYVDKEDVKSIPGAKWHGQTGQWIFNKSPIIAKYLKETFGFKIPALDELSRKLDTKNDPEICAMKLHTPLWHHQKEAVKLALVRDGTMFQFKMGCGKSLAAIAVINHENAHRVLIACPLKVIRVWPNQFDIHSERTYRILTLDNGSSQAKAKTLHAALNGPQSGRPLVVIINYDSMWREHISQVLLSVNWDVTVFDESHRIKAYTGKAVASKFCAKVGLRSKKRLALTGTPMPHSPLDLWAQFRALDHTVFGASFFHYKMKYALLGGYQGKEILRFINQDDLTKRLDFNSVYVSKETALDLPETIDIDIELELSQKMNVLYRSLEKDFIAWVEETGEAVTAANVLTKLLRLQQLTSGFVRKEDGTDVQIDETKIDWLRDFILDANEKVVVFCRFLQDLKRVRQLCYDNGWLYDEVSGKHNDLTPEATIKDETEVLGVQIQAGGLGVDFSKASLSVDYSVGFSLGDWEQARARLHRPGQLNKVTYYHLKAKRTVDFKLFEGFKKKKGIINYILDGLKKQDASE